MEEGKFEVLSAINRISHFEVKRGHAKTLSTHEYFARRISILLSKRKYSVWRENHQLNICLSACVIFLSVFLMSCDDNSDPLPFESEAWKAGGQTSGHRMSWDNPSIRYRMSRDIVENHRRAFEGQPKKRIIEMLGLPDSDSTHVFLSDSYSEKCGDGWNSVYVDKGKGFSMYYELGILESPYFDELQILELEYDSAGIIHSVGMGDR